MAATVSGSARGAIRFTTVNDAGVFSGVSRDLTYALNAIFAAGTGEDQCDKVGVARLDLVASTSQDLDLASGLVDAYGAALSGMVRARCVIIQVETATDAASVTVAAHPTTNGWTNCLSTGGLILRNASTKSNAGLILCAPSATGWAIAAGNKVIRFTPSAHAQTVKILVAGSSA